jgi:hypothetical protein
VEVSGVVIPSKTVALQPSFKYLDVPFVIDEEDVFIDVAKNKSMRVEVLVLARQEVLGAFGAGLGNQLFDVLPPRALRVIA